MWPISISFSLTVRSTPHDLPTDKDPLYHNLRAPNQWPSESHLPDFRAVFEDYMAKMSEISIQFTSLIAESIGLAPDAFDKFFSVDQQHKLKIVKYPDTGSGVGQGVGPHKDSMLTSYLLQASEHRGLQAQNTQGEWIDCRFCVLLLHISILSLSSPQRPRKRFCVCNAHATSTSSS